MEEIKWEGSAEISAKDVKKWDWIRSVSNPLLPALKRKGAPVVSSGLTTMKIKPDYLVNVEPSEVDGKTIVTYFWRKK